ncbi:arginine N-succinyltransferase [Candidatus Sororendozoicomonas aggregata]|uniref:arginine N-succinyltransferase n=1 Tax=Candidatus Sororendozoicomonas aggregata TaxID=3073239 RepID=UPI002ED08A85
MMIIRPITASDHDALWHIANKTGPGFTSLQPNAEAVKDRLKLALTSMVDNPPEEALYLMVMEDTNTHQIVGVCGLKSAVGLSAPWYNYKVSAHVHASRELDVYSEHNTLNLCCDHTGYSELCSLYLDPEYRHSKNGQLLSKSRFLFLAAHKERFHAHIFAELRGYLDEESHSPFWEGLGRHFFNVDFEKADQQISQGKAFISELMPRHPIYTKLLPKEAQATIGKTHKSTLAARKILEQEGFRYTNYVDIFDAGPLLETPVANIRAVRDARVFKVTACNKLPDATGPWLMGNDQFEDFRCILGTAAAQDDGSVLISKDQAEALNVETGDTLRLVTLSAAHSADKEETGATSPVSATHHPSTTGKADNE